MAQSLERIPTPRELVLQVVAILPSLTLCRFLVRILVSMLTAGARVVLLV
jgi:hypothetical protein